MNDEPRPTELLDAVARTLDEQVLAETSGATRHAVRIAANLCRVVVRELNAGDGAEIDSALADLLGSADGDDLARLIDERLRADDPALDSSVSDLLFADVCRRVDIAKPGYRTSDG